MKWKLSERGEESELPKYYSLFSFVVSNHE